MAAITLSSIATSRGPTGPSNPVVGSGAGDTWVINQVAAGVGEVSLDSLSSGVMNELIIDQVSANGVDWSTKIDHHFTGGTIRISNADGSTYCYAELLNMSAGNTTINFIPIAYAGTFVDGETVFIAFNFKPQNAVKRTADAGNPVTVPSGYSLYVVGPYEIGSTGNISTVSITANAVLEVG